MKRWLARLLTPLDRLRGYGSCLKCSISWGRTEPHVTWYPAPPKETVIPSGTQYSTENGIFVLCEHCWALLSPEDRVIYYMLLVYGSWDDPAAWPEIQAAVRAGW